MFGVEKNEHNTISAYFSREFEQSIPGDTIDISWVGLYCQVGPSLPEQTPVRIHLQADGEHEFTIESATVIQSEPHAGGSRIRCQFHESELPAGMQQLIDGAPLCDRVDSGDMERRKYPRHLVSWTVGLIPKRSTI